MPTWVIYSLISMLFAGLTSVVAKLGLKDISADLGLAVRTTVVFGSVLLNFFLFQSVREVGQLNTRTVGFSGRLGPDHLSVLDLLLQSHPDWPRLRRRSD